MSIYFIIQMIWWSSVSSKGGVVALLWTERKGQLDHSSYFLENTSTKLISMMELRPRPLAHHIMCNHMWKCWVISWWTRWVENAKQGWNFHDYVLQAWVRHNYRAYYNHGITLYVTYWYPRWIVELGRADICLEVSVMSSHMSMPTLIQWILL